MTLNQVIDKIQSICLAHKQIRNFYQGAASDWLTDKKTKYPSVLLQDNGGVISTKGQAATFGWKMFIADLVHVSEETKVNINDIQSDMISIAMDLLAQLNRNENLWVISSDNSIQLLDEEYENDNISGVMVDFTIRFQYTQNICAVPTTYTGYSPIDTGGTTTPWGVLAHVNNEIPAGLVNGINKVFTLAKNWLDPQYLEVYINGVRQTPTLHYTTSGVNTITFGDAPETSDNLLVDYISKS